MKNIGKKILIGVGTVAVVSFAAGALMYKRYMDDFYEFIIGEEAYDDLDLVDETSLEEDDFAEPATKITDITED